jgi:hypothetical protein
MNATQLPSRRARKTCPAPTRPVPEVLMEIAYRLHTTRVVARPPARSR